MQRPCILSESRCGDKREAREGLGARGREDTGSPLALDVAGSETQIVGSNPADILTIWSGNEALTMCGIRTLAWLQWELVPDALSFY